MRTVISCITTLAIALALSFSAVAQTYQELRTEANRLAEDFDFEGALSTANQALEKAQKEVGKKGLDYGLILAEKGVYQVFSYDAENGMQNLQNGLDIAKAAAGANDPEYLKVYSNLGQIHFFNEDYLAAVEVFTTTSEGLRSALGDFNEDYGTELNNLGLSQLYMGEYDNALKNFRRYLVVLEHNKQLGSGEHAGLLNNIATVFQDTGEHLQAERYFKESLRVSRKAYGKMHPEYANHLNNLGILYTDMGRYDEALELLEESRGIYLENMGEESLDYARALNNIANIAGLQGDYQKCESNYLAAQAIKERIIGPEHGSYIRGLNNLGTAYLNWGRTTEALAYLERCMDLIRPNRDESPLDYAEYASNLAGCYRALGRYADAEALYQEVLGIYESFVGRRHPVIAYVITAVGTLHLEQENFKVGEELFKEAVSIYEEYNDIETLDYIESVHMLGMSYLNMKDYKAAEPWLNKAVQLAKQVLGEGHPHYASFLINEAWMYEQMKKQREAERSYSKALSLYSDILENRLTFMSADEKSRYWNDIRIGYAFFNHFAVAHYSENPELLDKMYRYRLSTKSMVLNSTLKVRQRVLQSGDQQLIETFEAWKANKEYLNKLYSLPTEAMLAGKVSVDSLEDATTLMEKQLSEQSHVFAQQFNRKPIGWRDIQAQLASNEAAVEIVRAPHYGQDKAEFDIAYAVLIVRPGMKQPQLVLLENGRPMQEDFLDEYFYHIFQKMPDPHSYEVYWQPIANALQGVEHVYLSTDGVYNVMNVNTFQNPNTEKYVVDELSVQLVANTADVLTLKSAQPSGSGGNPPVAALFGYPNYYLDLTASLEDFKQENEELLANAGKNREFSREFLLLADLPGTKVEVESIDGILKQNGWQVQTYLGDDAVEQRIKELNSPTVLHLSTHGFFEFGEEHEAAGKLGLTRDLVVKNPLLRSGIMMAGSGFSLKMVQGDLEMLANMEDGILTGYEATALNLDETELVILSACLTRVGKASVSDSEGYFGMLRSFLMSGAKSVVASSWAVDDKATQELMVRFYKHWSSGKSKREAFRAAQLELKEEMPEPYYWGAFIMVGQ